MSKIRLISIIIILIVSTFHADGRDSVLYAGTSHRISAEIRPVYNLATHYFYRGNNPLGRPIGPGTAHHLKYSFSSPGTYQGIGLSYNTFYAKDVIGSPVSLYLFQETTLARLSERWSFGYEWNLGFSYGWKQTDVVNSRYNIYINVGIPFTWQASPSCEIQFGPEYTHFSNGDTRYPNGGANTIGMKFGVSHIIGNDGRTSIGHQLFKADTNLAEKSFKERVHCDIFIYGACRAGRIYEGNRMSVINRPFALGGISFNPLYRLNRTIHIGPSADIQTDTSAGLYGAVVDKANDEIISFSAPDLWTQTACGLSLRGELEMPYFSINIGAGYNIIRNTSDIKRFYSTYNLKTHLNDRVYICVGYNLSSVQYTHNLKLGFGFKL